jgi:hypothetical protein
MVEDQVVNDSPLMPGHDEGNHRPFFSLIWICQGPRAIHRREGAAHPKQHGRVLPGRAAAKCRRRSTPRLLRPIRASRESVVFINGEQTLLELYIVIPEYFLRRFKMSQAGI